MTIISNNMIHILHIMIMLPVIFYCTEKNVGIHIKLMLGIFLGIIVLFIGRPKLNISINNAINVIDYCLTIPLICFILIGMHVQLTNIPYTKVIGWFIIIAHLLMCTHNAKILNL